MSVKYRYFASFSGVRGLDAITGNAVFELPTIIDKVEKINTIQDCIRKHKGLDSAILTGYQLMKVILDDESGTTNEAGERENK